MSSLSSGILSAHAVQTMMDMGTNSTGSSKDFQPILQVIGVKLVGNNRYRVVLSDGTHFVQGMLSTQLNTYVTNGELQQESLIQIFDYMNNQIQGRNIIILLRMAVVDASQQPGHRLGNPVDWEKQQPQQHQPQHAAVPPMVQGPPQPLYNSTNQGSVMGGNSAAVPSSSSLYGGGMAVTKSNPYGSSAPPSAIRSSGNSSMNPYGSPSRVMVPSSTSTSAAPIVRSVDAASNITLINALSMYSNRWTIKARVTTKSDIRTWSNAKGEGSLFSVELLDASGIDIRATFFKEAVDKFYHFLEVGKVYRLSGGRIKVANATYNTCKSAYEMSFDQNAEIHLDRDAGEIQKQVYDLTKLADLEHMDAGKMVDVLAIVKNVGDVAHLTSKKSGQELTKCDLILTDDSGVEINLTLWGDKAQRAPSEFANAPVVAFRRAKISDFNGKSLSLNGSADLHPQISEAVSLQRWWDSAGSSNAPARSLTASSSGGSGGPAAPLSERKDIAAIKNEQLGLSGAAGDKADYLSFKATITYIKKDKEGGAWYTACPNAGDPCKNLFKVSQTVDGQWQCDKCGGTYPNCVRRWIFSAVLEDESSSNWVSFFNDQAETLLNHTTADEAYQRYCGSGGGEDLDAYESIFAPALHTEWIFRAKVKNEMIQDEARVKTSAMAMHPVDYVQESKALLAALAHM